MKIPRKKAAPRNIAAKALRTPRFRPKVEVDPNAYKRKGRYRPKLDVPEDDEQAR